MRPWSYSRLSTWEECPKQYFYAYREKLPSSREKSPAADRGSRIHSMCEGYLKGELKIYPPELQKVAAHAMLLKAKNAQSELKLAVTENWEVTDYDADNVYMRAIIDVVYSDDKIVHIQDWKTGRIYDSHAVQLENYVAVAASHFPEAEQYIARAIYIDQGVVSKPTVYNKDRVKPIRLLLDGRIKNAETDEIFPTRTGGHCKYCDYSSRFGGPCQF